MGEHHHVISLKWLNHRILHSFFCTHFAFRGLFSEREPHIWACGLFPLKMTKAAVCKDVWPQIMSQAFPFLFADGTWGGKAMASGGEAKCLGFMTYCLVCYLQGSISLPCVLAESRKGWEMYTISRVITKRFPLATRMSTL